MFSNSVCQLLGETALPEYRSQGGLINSSVFLIVLEAETSEIRVPARSCGGEDPPPGLHMVTVLLCGHAVEREVVSLASVFTGQRFHP